MKLDIKHLGQVFTPIDIVSEMMGLIKNNGKILEPSCGDGAFFDNMPGCVGIEIDEDKCPKSASNIDFFDYSLKNQFDTIIGNPPYVKYQDIINSTKSKLDLSLFDERTNLYLFFIHKCIKHLKTKGELIFIVPREFLKSTSAVNLNEFIYQNGTITDIIDLGDRIIFKGFSPNCIIFRFEKDNFSRQCNVVKQFRVINGQILFTSSNYSIHFKDLFFVKVGAVSGADKYFTNDLGNMDFVCSYTRKTNKTKKMFYNIKSKYLLKFKNFLINRKIKKFDEKNWFMWGRDYYKSNDNRIYVNSKTRNKKPFFTNKCKAYDGSILAIFPKFKTDEKIIDSIIDDLNNTNWEELGFVCDGRFLFNQRSLENSLLPDSFSKYFKYLNSLFPLV